MVVVIPIFISDLLCGLNTVKLKTNCFLRICWKVILFMFDYGVNESYFTNQVKERVDFPRGASRIVSVCFYKLSMKLRPKERQFCKLNELGNL